MLLFTLALCPPRLLFSQSGSKEEIQKDSAVRVPFVGCKSDGQAGPVDAPRGVDKIVQVDATTGGKLAYYKAEGSSGVLAPRGWYCFGVYGSNGATLYVTPQPIGASDVLSSTWGGISGPAIQISDASGGTSGRFEVARVVERVFPTDKAFAEGIIEEGIEPASAFPSGPYPTDRLIYRSDSVVEYETPPHSEGLGTDSQLKQGGEPIDGVAILQKESQDLLLLAMRLPSDINSLGPSIVRQIERENAAGVAGE